MSSSYRGHDEPDVQPERPVTQIVAVDAHLIGENNFVIVAQRISLNRQDGFLVAVLECRRTRSRRARRCSSGNLDDTAITSYSSDKSCSNPRQKRSRDKGTVAVRIIFFIKPRRHLEKKPLNYKKFIFVTNLYRKNPGSSDKQAV